MMYQILNLYSWPLYEDSLGPCYKITWQMNDQGGREFFLPAPISLLAIQIILQMSGSAFYNSVLKVSLSWYWNLTITEVNNKSEPYRWKLPSDNKILVLT